MIESRLLVAKPFAFLLNQSRSRLLYFSRSGEATVYTTAPLPRLASGKAKDLIQQKSRLLSAADMRLRLGDHIMP